MKPSPILFAVCRCAIVSLMAYGASASTVFAQSIMEIDLPLYNVGYSAQTGMLYASIASAAGEPYGNSLIEISPDTGKIKRQVYVGSEPDPLAISRDADVAYVGLDGAGSVQEINLDTMTLGTGFSLGFSQFGSSFAEAIAIMPGAPQTVAVSLTAQDEDPSFVGITIFDNGVPRSLSIVNTEGGDSIAFGSDPTVLYGYDNQISNFNLYRMSVSPTGVSVTTTVGNVFYGFDVKIITDGDTIFATSGATVDGNTLTLLGTYETGDFNAPVALDPATQSVQFASHGKIFIFDRATYVPTFAADVSSQARGTPRSAANCGRACLAVAYDSGQLLIVHDLQTDEVFADGFEGNP